jgi:DNA-binding beta-propeller fold protein YncE
MRSPLALACVPLAAAVASLAAAAVIIGGTGCGDEVAVYGDDPFARDPAPIGPLTGKILTSNVGDDTLSVLDPLQPGPARRLPVGFNPIELEGPHHVAADPAGRYVYVNLSLAVAGSGSGPHGVHGLGDQPGYVIKLDTSNGREAGRVRVDPNPGDNTLSADGKTLFVTHYDEIGWRRQMADSSLALIDTATMTIRQRRALCPAGHGVRLSADGQTLYATCAADELAVVDLRDPTLPVRRVTVPGGVPGTTGCQRCPYAVAVAPDGTAWVSSLGPNNGSAGRGSVDVFDPGREGGSFDPARQLLLSGRPIFAGFAPIAGTPGAYRAYVPEQAGPGDRLHVLAVGAAGAPWVRLDPIALDPAMCLNAHMLLVGPGSGPAQLICEGDHKGPGSFLWLDLEARQVLGVSATGVFPDGLVLVPAP